MLNRENGKEKAHVEEKVKSKEKGVVEEGKGVGCCRGEYRRKGHGEEK